MTDLSAAMLSTCGQEAYHGHVLGELEVMDERGDASRVENYVHRRQEGTHTYTACADKDAYMELPLDDAEKGERAKLKRWLNVMRGAARGWKREWRSKFERVGYVMGSSASTIMVNEPTHIRCVVHGDDFAFIGRESLLTWIATSMCDMILRCRDLVDPNLAT